MDLGRSPNVQKHRVWNENRQAISERYVFAYLVFAVDHQVHFSEVEKQLCFFGNTAFWGGDVEGVDCLYFHCFCYKS